jgi:hypothetical protein
MSAAQFRTMHFQCTYAAVALANGRDDLLPASAFDLNDWSTPPGADWPSGVVAHCAIRRDPAAFVRECVERGRGPRHGDARAAEGLHALMLAYLATGRAREAVGLLDRLTPDSAWHAYRIGCALADARLDEPLERWIAAAGAADGDEPAAGALGLLRARRALEGGDLEAAARHLRTRPGAQTGPLFREGLVLQTMLSSLGLVKTPSRAALEAEGPRALSGTPMTLTRMFRGEIAARPDDTFPHPLWRPEWRLWLGLWLEARSLRAEARAVVEQARDARYGATHAQRAIEELLARCAPRRGGA